MVIMIYNIYMANGTANFEAFDLWLRIYNSLNESQRRWYASEKALALGRGGISRIGALTGLSRTTITKGIRELKSKKQLDTSQRIRQPGSGRKKLTESTPSLVKELKAILEENTLGDPMSLLRWTTKSTRNLSGEMTRKGHPLSAMSVCNLLHELGYSLQGNHKTKEGEDHPDRDAQFRRINERAKAFRASGNPIISVDTKKKERVGEFKNAGKTWETKGFPKEVNTYDYPHLGIGTACPYGVYDPERNEGMVNVGMSHDTAEFAVESIRQWWKKFGCRHYPKAKRLLICADGGGSNGCRNRAWKYHIQNLSDKTGLSIFVCHYPPGTSKWNKIEHRMFSFISLNWKGQPLVNFETVVNLIGGTKTRSGLKIKSQLDTRTYEKGLKISDAEMESLSITYDDRYPKWNYMLSPRTQKQKKTGKPSKNRKQ